MIFEMRSQILMLAAALMASVLAGYMVAEAPASSPPRPDNFTATNGVSEGAVAIFTEFGNEMAWEGRTLADKALTDSGTLAGNCIQPKDAAGSGGLLEGLIHRVSQSVALAEEPIKPDTGCTPP
jgi:hypothetical protein